VVDVQIVIGSITEQDVDAIVNSANTSMVMGGGVAAAILAEAGPEVEEEAISRAPVQVGDVVVTGGGDLPIERIFHVAVVGDVPPDIYECTLKVLERAAELGVERLAFPALGTGSAGVPVREAARAMCRAIAEFVAAGSSISSIHVVLWDEEHFAIFERALRRAMRHRREDDF